MAAGCCQYQWLFRRELCLIYRDGHRRHPGEVDVQPVRSRAPNKGLLPFGPSFQVWVRFGAGPAVLIVDRGRGGCRAFARGELSTFGGERVRRRLTGGSHRTPWGSRGPAACYAPPSDRCVRRQGPVDPRRFVHRPPPASAGRSPPAAFEQGTLRVAAREVSAQEIHSVQYSSILGSGDQRSPIPPLTIKRTHRAGQRSQCAPAGPGRAGLADEGALGQRAPPVGWAYYLDNSFSGSPKTKTTI